MNELRVDLVVTSGTFRLDGSSWDVDNNVWLIGDDSEVVIIDAAHDANPIIEKVGQRRVRAIFCTHAHNDHISAAPNLSEAFDAPILLHPGDDVLWKQIYPNLPYHPVNDKQRHAIAGTQLEVIHTPGHSPGSTCLYFPEASLLCSGDTLFAGGPGATGRSYSDFPTIIGSIRERLFALPDDTVVHTGHGHGTRIGVESPHLTEWIARGC